MIGHGRDNGVDVFVVEQIAIATRHRQIRSHDLAGESMSAVVEISGARALDAGQLDRGAEQPRALHADADDAETHRITWCHILSRWLRLRFEENRTRANRPARCCRAHLEEFTSREVAFRHSDLPAIAAISGVLRVPAGGEYRKPCSLPKGRPKCVRYGTEVVATR